MHHLCLMWSDVLMSVYSTVMLSDCTYCFRIRSKLIQIQFDSMTFVVLFASKHANIQELISSVGERDGLRESISNRDTADVESICISSVRSPEIEKMRLPYVARASMFSRDCRRLKLASVTFHIWNSVLRLCRRSPHSTRFLSILFRNTKKTKWTAVHGLV